MQHMKKIISKREYDTEKATLVKKFTSGNFGDPNGYEESLYETPAGYMFLYCNGGEDSAYPTESIKSISKVKAEEWLSKH